MDRIVYPILSKNAATESTLSEISSQLPSEIGPRPLADSLSVNVSTQVSPNNSTSATLGVGQTWTGTGDDVSNFGVISVAVRSNVASNTLGLEFQASNDNINWYTSDSYTILANTLKNYSLAPPLKYFRVRYTNDGVAQAIFFIETTYRQTYVQPSSHRIGDTVVADDDSILVTAQIVGQTTGGGGGYRAVKVNPSGALTTETTVTSSALPTGAATLSEQQTQSSTLSGISGKLPATLGQKTMAESMAVTIASNQSNVNTALASDGYSPDPSVTNAGNNPLLVDGSNRLETHSTVLTDEGSFRDDFSGVALSDEWTFASDAGTTIAVANSKVTLSSGTTSGEIVYIERFGDYLPYTMRVYCKVSQRIANQSIIYGFVDAVTNIAKGAYIEFTGTTSNQINFISQASADSTDIQTTTVNLPDNILTNEFNLYQIDISANSAILSINNKAVVTHTNHIPGPYDLLNLAAQIENTGTPASSTDLEIDYIYFTNYDRLQIDNDFNGEPIKTVGEINFNNVQTDLFGKLRVSQADQTLSLYNASTNHPLYFNSATVGTASATFVPAKTAAQLTVSTGATDSIIWQTRRHFRYTPGKPYQLNVSGNFGLPKANNRRRFGYFDDLNGGFFQIDSTGISVVSRTNASGTVVDTVVSQANWNIDKADGTTASKFNLQNNLDKHILFIIEWLWHGAVGVRFGIAVNRTIVYLHQFDAFAASTVPYWRTPSLPIRIENTNTGVTAGATDAFFVCFAYTKESLATTVVPYKFTASNGLTSKTVRLPTPTLSIRPKLTFNGITNRVPILPSDINIQTVGNNVVYVQVYLNPTLTGASWVSAGTNSATEYDVTATAATGGTLIFEGYVPAAGAQEIELKEYDDLVLLGLNIAGSSSDILTIVLSAGVNTTTYTAMQWKEFQ